MTGATTGAPLVRVENLSVDIPGAFHSVRALDRVSFLIGRERLGVVGESGAGKSTVGRCLLGLLPPDARVSARRLDVDGHGLCDAASLRGSELSVRAAALRGRTASMILQDPRQALNPIQRVGAQIAETLRCHHGLSRRAARERGLETLASARVADPERVWRAFPHELSGGLAQRAAIAAALAPDPALLVADEPTSALDVMARGRVLSVIDEQVRARGMGVILIGHDLPLVSRFCDRLLVMRGGAIVEELAHGAPARHPYTQHLLAVSPRLDRPSPAPNPP